MMYARFPLSLRNVEDLVHERGIGLCHESENSGNTEKQALTGVVMTGLFAIIGAPLPILLSIYKMPLPHVWVVSAGMMLVFDWITIGLQYNALKSALKRRNAWDGFFWVLLEGSVQLPLVLILLPVLTAHAFALYATMLIVSIFQAAALLMLLVLDIRHDAD